jgi:hypothetical protein
MDTEFGGMADRAFYSTPQWKSLFPASFEDEVGSKASFFQAQWLERPWDRKRKVDATLRWMKKLRIGIARELACRRSGAPACPHD